MGDIKFEKAKFFDTETGGYKLITPDEYNKALHGGRLECPCPTCHGSLSFVRGHLVQASNIFVTKHFKTDGQGDDHAPNCDYEPMPEARQEIRLAEALAKGNDILFNVNFSTSLVRERGKLAARFAKAAMPKIGGEYRPHWLDRHRGHYTRSAGYSLEKIGSDMKALRNAAIRLGKPVDQVRDNVQVSYLHGVMPWTSFHLPYDQGGSFTAYKNNLHAADVFKILYADMLAKPYVQNFWNASPAFRAGARLIPSARKTAGNELFTDVRDTVEIGGKQFPLQDVIKVRDGDIRRQIQCAESFSIVATPYIERQQVEKILREGKGYVHLNWPVTNSDQLIFKP
jgi:hypothetical protein